MSSRREQKEAARQARLQAEVARAQKRERTIQRLFLTGGFLAIAIAGGAVFLLVNGGAGSAPSHQVASSLPPYRTHNLAAASRVAGAQEISYDYSYGIGNHVAGRVKYPTNPPTNGPHFFMPAADGSYIGKAMPTTEQVVHSLEHGRIVLQYAPGLSDEKLRTLRSLYAESPQHVLLVQNQTNMPCEVAASAWGHGVLCPKFSPASIDALRAFRDKFRDHGPETVI
jgi:hypothetical protein